MTTLGDEPKKARYEKLKDERRAKRLPVRKRRDGAETRKGSRRRVGGRLSCRPPEIERKKKARKLRQAGRPGRTTKPRGPKSL